MSVNLEHLLPVLVLQVDIVYLHSKILNNIFISGDVTDSVAATVLWNALMGVDTFFVIGGCLLSYHTMKELDKTKGGNAKMWAMFYIHRYIR